MTHINEAKRVQSIKTLVSSMLSNLNLVLRLSCPKGKLPREDEYFVQIVTVQKGVCKFVLKLNLIAFYIL